MARVPRCRMCWTPVHPLIIGRVIGVWFLVVRPMLAPRCWVQSSQSIRIDAVLLRCLVVCRQSRPIPFLFQRRRVEAIGRIRRVRGALGCATLRRRLALRPAPVVVWLRLVRHHRDTIRIELRRWLRRLQVRRRLRIRKVAWHLNWHADSRIVGLRSGIANVWSWQLGKRGRRG